MYLVLSFVRWWTPGHWGTCTPKPKTNQKLTLLYYAFKSATYPGFAGLGYAHRWELQTLTAEGESITKGSPGACSAGKI